MKKLILALSVVCAGFAGAEEGFYGEVTLDGLSRNVDWPVNRPGPSLSMVCNVNGPDGFLTIRDGPGGNYKSNRKLNRLAIIEVDTRARQGRWVRVLDAYRTHTKNGHPQNYKSLSVRGWAHDAYLCAFIA